MHYPKRRVRTGRGADMGAVIMLGTLFGLIALIFGLVLRYDPQARPSQGRDQ